MRKEITAERVRQLLNYDPVTGLFTWKVRVAHCIHEGDKAGCKVPRGYIVIRVDKLGVFAHRLAWIYMEGEWPENVIDHINGDPSDNRWCNLRAATHSQNAFNRKQKSNKIRGVGWHPRDQRWYAVIWVSGKATYLGNFKVYEDAVDARLAAEKIYHGDFSNQSKL